MRLFFLCAGALALASFSGCKVFDTNCEEDDRECLSNPLFAKGVGGECTRNADCKEGLSCTNDTCQPTGDTETGADCRITAECGDDDYCGSRRVCQLAGAGEEGDECQTTGNCGHGLVCQAPDLSQMGTLSLTELAQISGLCEEAGTLEQGAECDQVADCLAGLACLELEAGMGRHCISLLPTDLELPAIPLLWEGVECAEVEEDAAIESYFAVPRSGAERDPGDFYSLPFPNDIRLEDGHIDLSDHPIPPDSFSLPFVSRYVDVAQEDIDGFSTNPVVYFRFSHPYDFATIDKPALNVKIVDITPDSPEYDTEASIEWKTTSGNLSNYICPHWLGLRRPVGSPLRPATTYAAIITTGIKPCGEKDEDGKCTSEEEYARGEDFAAMLGGSQPSEAELRAAWQKYAPLREWIADTGQSASSILNAAVFTTQDPEALMPKLREAVHDDAAPVISDLTVCESATTESPCAVGERGRCSAASDDFTEVHGRIQLPIFQQGTAPYLEPEDGGGFELDGSGSPVVQSHEDVCFAMSVPNDPAPAGGYPVLVYAHGTGGAFNGEMDAGGFAQVLATASVPAVLVAIDLPQHGERRGDSDEEPEGLFYNFLNPRAARDNVLQGAADLFTVVRWVREGGVMVDGDAVAFDPDHIALMGHSQGSTHTALMAPYEPDAIGVVLSGNGGHLATSMLTKTMPVDIASVVPIGLLDPDDQFKLAGGGYNPALSIIQSVFDRADPINYAHRMYRNPAATAPTGHHLFMTYGRGDSFSPEETQAAYALAGVLPLVEPVVKELRLPHVTPPVRENQSADGTARTVGLRQYQPVGGVDGHFVGTRSGQPGRPDVEAFLEALLAGGTPVIGGP
jgi:pimeloyl-ACP methyl ester carboxylesterase